MKESEKAEKNVNAREIIANVLKELGMNAPSFSTATGIAYQRIFDLQRGRTKKFNPGVVNMICAAFPTINKASEEEFDIMEIGVQVMFLMDALVIC